MEPQTKNYRVTYVRWVEQHVSIDVMADSHGQAQAFARETLSTRHDDGEDIGWVDGDIISNTAVDDVKEL